jgi:hypothetical protein
MRSFPFLALAGIAALALNGCQAEQKPAEAKTAQGEILPGSASDAMLALDSVRSQPPLAPIEIATGKPGKSGGPGVPASDAADAEPGAVTEGEAAPPAAAPATAAEKAE